MSTDDEVLEKMLMEAQRLALRMRSSTNSVADASRGSYLSETDHFENNEVLNIVSCDSNTSQPEQASRVSLHSFFDKINQQESQESKESHNSSAWEEKSYASVASAQQDAIAEAVKSTRDMERTLRALSGSPSNHSTAASTLRGGVKDPETSNGRAMRKVTSSTSPNNSRVDDEMNTSSSHISWEKVDPIREEDEDFVTIVDYTSPKKKSFPRDDSEIKWEKISSPDKDEDDYVPIADYSRPLNRSPMQRIRGAILPNNNNHNHYHHKIRSNGFVSSQVPRRTTRRRRRKALKVMAVVMAVSLVIYWNFFWQDGSSPSVSPSTVLRESVPVLVHEGEPSVLVDEIDDEGRVIVEEAEEEVTQEPVLLLDEPMSPSEFEGILYSLPGEEFCADQEQVMVEPIQQEIIIGQTADETGKTRPRFDPAKEELICLFGRRCSDDVKERNLFTRDNLELLLASMMQ